MLTMKRLPIASFHHRSLRGLLLIAPCDLLFLIVTLAVVFRAPLLLSGDGDLARHLRVGHDILAARGLFFADPYSWTMHGAAFVPYEWGSEVLVALAEQVGGLPAVIILTAFVIGLTNVFLLMFLRQSGISPSLALCTAIAAILIGSIHWRARPHIWTPLVALLLVWMLEQPNRRRLWLVAPLFVVWVNLHGGFLFGLVVIGIYLFGAIAEWVISRDATMRRLVWMYAGMLGLAVIASCLNPSGIHIFTHTTGYFGQHFLINITEEYQSPNFHTIQPQVFAVVVCCLIMGFTLNPTRPPFSRLLLCLVTFGFALYSARNIPLFAVTALPVAALDVDRVWQRSRIARRADRAFMVGEQGGVAGLWALVGAIILVGVSLRSAWLPTQFMPQSFPVAAVERARAAHLPGRMFNELAWGGYVLYEWPEQQVYIDGQTDFYGEALSRQYVHITTLKAGWRDNLRQQGIATVLIPTATPLAAELTRDSDWRVWYTDSTATIFRRASG